MVPTTFAAMSVRFVGSQARTVSACERATRAAIELGLAAMSYRSSSSVMSWTSNRPSGASTSGLQLTFMFITRWVCLLAPGIASPFEVSHIHHGKDIDKRQCMA